MLKKKYVDRNVIIAISVDPDNEERCDDCNWLDEFRGHCGLFDEWLVAEELRETCESCGHETEIDVCLRCKDCLENEVELQK